MNPYTLTTSARGIVLFSLVISSLLLSAAAWFTHVIYCLFTGSWLLLIAGAIVVPIGVVHGLGLWGGVWP